MDNEGQEIDLNKPIFNAEDFVEVQNT